MEVSDDVEFYFFGNFGKSDIDEAFQYRQGIQRVDTGVPTGRGGGNRSTLFRTQMAFNHPDENFRLSSGDAYLGATLQTNAAGDIIDAAGNVLRTVDGRWVQDGDPVYLEYGYGAIERFPGGYIPFFQIEAEDIGAFVGFRGDFDNGLHWDLTASFGRNSNQFFIRDTINASQGAPIGADGRPDASKTQTEFALGTVVGSEKSLSLDFTYPFEVSGIESAHLAFGAEYRSDRYQKIAGETASWKTGPLTDLRTGTDGFQGKDPGQQSNDERHNIAAYVDAEFDLTEDFSFGAAARFEDFSDFGSTFNWKVASRYQLADAIALRGAVSTGFHAPSIGQINDLNATTGFAGGLPTYSARLPADHPAAIVFGAVPLKAETAFNLSAGIVLTPADRTVITIDAFSIKLEDRIGSSQSFRRSNASLATQWDAFDASGFNGASDITSLFYFTNATDTKTQGVEVVATQGFELGRGDVNLTLGYAHITHKALNADELLLSESQIFNISNSGIKDKGSLAATYTQDALSVYARVRYFGKALARQRRGEIFPETGTPIWESPAVAMFDLNLNYKFTEQYSVTVGAENIFDKFPKDIAFSPSLGRKYMGSGQPWQGGQYYVRFRADF